MSQSDSSKWKRFSDYEVRTDGNGVSYIRPVPGSASSIYDPMSAPDKTAMAVISAAEALEKGSSDDSAALELIRSTGLLGLALDAPGEYVFPFGGGSASDRDLLLAQRGPEYGCVFSENYAEKVDDICAWLKGLNGCSCSERESEFTSLKSMAEYCICSLARAGKLHTCVQCGKIYYSEDPDSETCSKACAFQYSVSDSAPPSKKRFIGHIIAGG